MQALTGAMWLTGRRDDPPFLFGAAIADQYTGLHLVIGILAALAHRHRTGEGQRVDVDLLSCMMAVQQQELTVYLNHGMLLRAPAGNVGHPGLPGRAGIYRTADGYLMLAMTPCPKLAGILGFDWLDEYDSNEKMYAARDEGVRPPVGAFRRRADGALGRAALGAHDVWCAPVQDYAQLEQDPQVRTRGSIWDVPYGEGDRAIAR